MSTLFDRHRVLLGIIGYEVRGAFAFERLCDKLAPIVREALEADRLTARFGQPAIPVGGAAPTAAETVIALALAWIDALSVCARQRGAGIFCSLDDDLLPTTVNLDGLFGIGRDAGLDAEAVRGVFRDIKTGRKGPRAVPIEAFRVLRAIGFFAEPADSGIPDDFLDALADEDCAYVWSGSEAYVLLRQEETRCHIERVTRADVIVESGPDGARSERILHRGWTRERLGSFFLFGRQPAKYAQFALEGFREFLSGCGLSAYEPVPIESYTV